MNLKFSTFNSVANTYKKIANNVGQNQEYYLKLWVFFLLTSKPTRAVSFHKYGIWRKNAISNYGRFLALISANLLVANIKSEVDCRKEVTSVCTAVLLSIYSLIAFTIHNLQKEKNELYKADLKMFTSHMKNDDWISSLSERTNDPVERPKIIKVLVKWNCSMNSTRQLSSFVFCNIHCPLIFNVEHMFYCDLKKQKVDSFSVSHHTELWYLSELTDLL